MQPTETRLSLGPKQGTSWTCSPGSDDSPKPAIAGESLAKVDAIRFVLLNNMLVYHENDMSTCSRKQPDPPRADCSLYKVLECHVFRVYSWIFRSLF